MNTAETKTAYPKVTGFTGIKDGDVFQLAGFEFIKFPNIKEGTPVVMRDIAFISRFGDSNDLRTSGGRWQASRLKTPGNIWWFTKRVLGISMRQDILTESVGVRHGLPLKFQLLVGCPCQSRRKENEYGNSRNTLSPQTLGRCNLQARSQRMLCGRKMPCARKLRKQDSDQRRPATRYD